MDVKSVYGAYDVTAELRDVNVTEVNVLAAGGRNRAIHRAVTLMFGPHVKVGFRGSRRCWRSMRLT